MSKIKNIAFDLGGVKVSEIISFYHEKKKKFNFSFYFQKNYLSLQSRINN